MSTLEESYNNCLKQKESLRKRIQTNYERLTKKGQDISNHTKIVQQVTDILRQEKILKPFLKCKDILSVDFEDIRKEIKKVEGSEKREELSETIRLISGLENLEAVTDEPTEQNRLRENIQEKTRALQKTRGALFKRLYEIVKEILESEDWHDLFCCPACNSKLEDSLVGVIDGNLHQYNRVQEANKNITETWNRSKWITRLKNLENNIVSTKKPIEEKYTSFYERFRNNEIEEADLDVAVEQIQTLESLRGTTISELKEKKREIEDNLPDSLVSLTQQIEYSEQLKQSIEEHKNLPSESDIDGKINKIKRWKTFIEIASALFSKAETDYTKEKTQSIDIQYCDMYTKITNNPNIIPKLKKAVGSENLHLRLEKFYGLDDLTARTLLPESYKNAFAISLYLCAALNDKRPAQFMVLDDITSSFDAGHQYYLMELIRNAIAMPANPDGLQIILLSHDGLLEKYFDTFSNTTAWNHQRLRGMPPKGYLLSQAQDANHLRAAAERYLNTGEVSHADPLIRQYLEFKILEIIRKVNIHVPIDFSIRDDRKMVKNSLDAIKYALELHRSAGTLVLEQNQVSDFQNIHVPALISNWISHYATGITASLSPYVLLGVLDTIDKVSDCFKYPCSCSGTQKMRFYKNLFKKRCNC